jgi:hypothetical protein
MFSKKKVILRNNAVEAKGVKLNFFGEGLYKIKNLLEN